MLVTRTRRIAIGLSLCILIACAVLYATYYLIEKTSQKVVAFETQAEEQRQKIEADESLKDFIKDTGDEIETLTKRIVASEGTVEFIETVESLAVGQGLSITFDTVKEDDPPINKEQFKILKLSFATVGSWKSTYHFIELIESLPYKVSIQNVGITKVEGMASSTSQWNGAFTIGVLKYK
jgi:Tfp pilus assembly protein PilO